MSRVSGLPGDGGFGTLIGGGAAQAPIRINVVDGDNVYPVQTLVPISSAKRKPVEPAETVRSIGQPEIMPTNPPEASGYTEQNREPVAVVPAPVPVSVGEPTSTVTYEIPGYGELVVHYHRVIRSGAHLVLVFDTRSRSAYSFPRHSESVLGMRVHEAHKLFSVRTTGIQFQLGTQEICVLSVEKEVSYSEFERASAPDNRTVQSVLDGIGFPLPGEFDGEDGSYSGGGDAPGESAHDELPGI